MKLILDSRRDVTTYPALQPMKKTEVMSIKTTPAEYNYWKISAAALGMSLSDLVREAMSKYPQQLMHRMQTTAEIESAKRTEADRANPLCFETEPGKFSCFESQEVIERGWGSMTRNEITTWLRDN